MNSWKSVVARNDCTTDRCSVFFYNTSHISIAILVEEANIKHSLG